MPQIDLDLVTERLSTYFDHSTGGAAAGGLLAPILRLLARGRPVELAEIAEATGRPQHEVETLLKEVPDIETQAGRVTGFGLTLAPTSHRFTVDGKTLYAWCALDTLMFPALLGVEAQVESPCHATGAPVRVHVTPDEVKGVSPADAVVSLVVPQPSRASVRAAFCCEVHFFSSSRAASDWLAARPDALLLSVRDAYEVGRRLGERLGPGGTGARAERGSLAEGNSKRTGMGCC